MFENIVVGKPIVENFKLFGKDEEDWENNEKQKTLFTEERFLPLILKEAGVVPSTSEVRRNRPDLVKTLDSLDFIKIKWGKKFIFITVGE